jgi:hypothetical protein
MSAKPRRKQGAWWLAIRRVFFEDDLSLWIIIALLALNDLPCGDVSYRASAVLLCAILRLLFKWIDNRVRDPMQLL